jgi:hypothetical protein
MRTHLVRRGPLAAAALSLFFVATLLAAPFLNPSFETNGGAGTEIFTSWTVTDAGTGGYYVQTGATSPLNAFAVASPTNGSFAAMTDQGGPGSHLLTQNITVTSAEQVVRFDLFIHNYALGGAFSSPATLDYTVSPNQQFRADIMTTASPIDDVGAGVLLNLYQTKPGDPAISGYKQVSGSLAPFVGQTVRLRFAEVDNQGVFNAGVDNITTGVPVPTLSPVMLGLLAAALVAAALFLLKRS